MATIRPETQKLIEDTMLRILFNKYSEQKVQSMLGMTVKQLVQLDPKEAVKIMKERLPAGDWLDIKYAMEKYNVEIKEDTKAEADKINAARRKEKLTKDVVFFGGVGGILGLGYSYFTTGKIGKQSVTPVLVSIGALVGSTFLFASIKKMRDA